MAKISQRFWESGPRKAPRSAWGYTVQVPCSPTRPCPPRTKRGEITHKKGLDQVRIFRESWTKEDAEKALAARLMGVTPEPAPAAPAGPTLQMVMDKFLEARRKSKKNKSVKDDEERSRPLLAFFGVITPVSRITTAWVADYRLHRMTVKSRRGRPLSTTTINRECQVLRGALHLALEREEIAKVPKFTMEDEAPRERWLTAEEITILVAACRKSKNRFLAPMVVLAVHTGLRLSELTGLEWRELDMTRGLITLDASRTKSGKSRTVPLNGDCYAVLAPLRSDAGGLEAKGKVWGGMNDIDTAFRCAVKRAGLESADVNQRVTFHTLRHSFASLFAQRTGDLLRLQKILGHASYRTTEETYTRFTPDYVLGATAALEGLGGSENSASVAHGAPTDRGPLATRG